MKQDYIKMKLNDYTSTSGMGNIIKLAAERSPLLDMLNKIREMETSAIESYLKLRIRKKPFYLPKFLWQFILSKLVYIQYLEAGEITRRKMDKKKMAELAEKELKEEERKKQFKVIKEAIKGELEKLEEKKKQRRKLDEEIKIHKQNIDNIREGRLDLIEERQRKDEKAKEISTIIIEREKIVEKPYPVYPYIPYKSWYEPYKIWYTPLTTGDYTGDVNTDYTFSTTINCSVAKDASPGTYELNSGKVMSFT